MSANVPVYFEQSWAILSSIGLVNCLFGLMIIGITSLSPISIVPIIVSAAGAVANGLCYYAFYADHAKTGMLVAAGFADVCWLVQEAGLSFYSYLILTRVLKRRSRTIFMAIFWTLMAILLAIRTSILINRAKDIISDSDTRQPTINHLHIGYFSTIALMECVSAFFLLRKSASARQTSIEASSTSSLGLFSYMMRSTEIRLTCLAVIGVSRAVTYSFQETAQSATTIAGQVDRFVYTLECLFPVMLFIDILASKLVVSNHVNDSSSNSRSRYHQNTPIRKPQNSKAHLSTISMYPISHSDPRGDFTSSRERIVEEGAVSRVEAGEMGEQFELRNGRTIVKTVEFEFHTSAA